ncbi:hypothetical protein DFH28DRAFT_880224, partial [Melampsora americana]
MGPIKGKTQPAINYNINTLADIPSRIETECRPMLLPIPEAPPEVYMGIEQCFKCTEFGHRYGFCNGRKMPSECVGFVYWRHVEVKPGVRRVYWMRTLWPSLMPPLKEPATAELNSMGAHAAAATNEMSTGGTSTPSNTIGNYRSKRRAQERECASIIREGLYRARSCSNLTDETLF